MVRARFPRVRLLRNEVNRHYTASNNWAIDEARGQYLCLLNNDTIVLPEAFDRMLAFLRETPDAGAVGSRLLNEDGSTQWSIKPLPDLGAALFGGRSIMIRMFPNNLFSRRRILHLDRDMTKPSTAGYISGAAKMMPRKVIDEVGHLDSRLFYHVDADYCKRIVDAGYKCYYLPTAAVIHLNHKGGTYGQPCAAISFAAVVSCRLLRVLLQAHAEVAANSIANSDLARPGLSFPVSVGSPGFRRACQSLYDRCSERARGANSEVRRTRRRSLLKGLNEYVNPGHEPYSGLGGCKQWPFTFSFVGLGAHDFPRSPSIQALYRKQDLTGLTPKSSLVAAQPVERTGR